MKKPKRRAKKHPIIISPGEDHRSVAVTVAWMLGTLVTLLADVAALIAFGLNSTMMPGLMLFTAAVCGVVTLAILPLVYRIRATPPPRSIAIVSIIAALLPLAVLIAIAFS